LTTRQPRILTASIAERRIELIVGFGKGIFGQTAMSSTSDDVSSAAEACEQRMPCRAKDGLRSSRQHWLGRG
jgi:hypothetical protein